MTRESLPQESHKTHASAHCAAAAACVTKGQKCYQSFFNSLPARSALWKLLEHTAGHENFNTVFGSAAQDKLSKGVFQGTRSESNGCRYC
jgi:hypothetical protein